ncbi:SDR family oxidoreductase [Variovorax paradoxus]|uniref:SDR family oxidoreductase n=1 Tax=Variovorax TaxID=34072 RepID=UPI00247AF007
MTALDESRNETEGNPPKVAVVTGAGSGIGKAVALAMLKAGYRVALVGRREQVLAEVAARSAAPDRAFVVPADVTDADAVGEMFERVRSRWGRVDVLFNNAGISAPPVEWHALSATQWREVVDVNLNGMFFCLQQAFRTMKDQRPMGGRIINNGSIAAHAPRPNAIAYTATKHAVSGMTKAVSLDGRAYDIACGQIDIGNAATDMADQFARGILQANGQLASEPLMDVNLVADAVLHMAGLPLEANILFQTLLATKMPYIGRG